MAIISTHAVMGAGLRAGAAKIAGMSPDAQYALAILGMIEGAAPDGLDWLAWKFGAERWKLYAKMHTPPNFLWFVFWGWGLHAVFDLPFHAHPGEAWWNRLWFLDIGGLLLGMLALYLVFF